MSPFLKKLIPICGLSLVLAIGVARLQETKLTSEQRLDVENSEHSALEYFKAKQYESAMKEAEHVLTLVPDHPRAKTLVVLSRKAMEVVAKRSVPEEVSQGASRRPASRAMHGE